MSIVTVQLGQCGNQIGNSLFSTLIHDAHQPPPFTSLESTENINYRQDILRKYFTENKKGQHCAKAVLVDMEAKVVQKCKNISKQEGIVSLLLVSHIFIPLSACYANPLSML